MSQIFSGRVRLMPAIKGKYVFGNTDLNVIRLFLIQEFKARMNYKVYIRA